MHKRNKELNGEVPEISNNNSAKLKLSDVKKEEEDGLFGFEDDELDFEEDFQDDDGLMQFGLSDAEEREATKRTFDLKIKPKDSQKTKVFNFN